MSDTSLQYEDAGGTFFPCGRTVKRMEPGFYDVVGQPGRGYGLAPKNPITDELIDLKGTIADDLFADMKTFLGKRDAFATFGLTHKRGYLMYGPPGSGKTSLGQMLARRFIESVGGVVMFTPNVNTFYNGVEIMRKVEPGRPSMYILEESESILNNVACLSILDGELSIQGSVFVAMTNYKDEMPPRLANRPGRFDMVVRVDAPPRAVQVEYLRRVEARGGSNSDKPEQIVDSLDGLAISLAHLREAFISHVLLDLPLQKVRERFEEMAGKGSTGGAKIVHMDDGDEPEPDDDNFLDHEQPDTEGYG